MLLGLFRDYCYYWLILFHNKCVTGNKQGAACAIKQLILINKQSKRLSQKHTNI